MKPGHRSGPRVRRDGMLHTGLLIGAAFAGLAAPTIAWAQAVIASSDFETGSDGWFAVGDPQCPHPEYWGVGGNPGGRIRIIDVQEGVWMWFAAPAKFIGDQSAAYGGSLSFDILLENSSDTGNLTKVWLIGDGIRLVMATTDNPPRNTWHAYRFNLDESEGWMARDCVGGREATREDMIHVLSNLSALLIQGEYSGGRDVCSLDNVVLLSGPCNGAISRLTASCKDGSSTVVVKLKGALSGADYAICLDGADCVMVATNARGRAKAVFENVAPGEHEASAPDCGLTAVVVCGE
ncbi:MAG: hypothetical protein FLDDKLPJ_02451 [Phycisphaerae bacterium]|nr:hypothetical protein [Phycisphaerae bacterium]